MFLLMWYNVFDSLKFWSIVNGYYIIRDNGIDTYISSLSYYVHSIYNYQYVKK